MNAAAFVAHACGYGPGRGRSGRRDRQSRTAGRGRRPAPWRGGADHVADHHAEAEPARLGGHARPSVRPPHLSSLMLTTLKRPTRAGTSASVSALSSAASGIGDRSPRGRPRGRAPAAARAATRAARPASTRIEPADREALIGVDAEPDVGARVAHRLTRSRSISSSPVSLSLIARACGIRGRRGHDCGLVGADRERRDPRRRLGRPASCQAGRPAAALRAPTTRSRARCARRRPATGAQLLAGDAALETRAIRFDRAASCATSSPK